MAASWQRLRLIFSARSSIAPLSRPCVLILAVVCWALCALAASTGLAAPALKPSVGGEPPQAPITEECSEPIAKARGQVLCGTLNPLSSAKVGAYFAYNKGASCTGGSTVAVKAEKQEGQDIKVTGSLGGLLPDTEYSYCVVATNANGETFGQSVTFTTAPESRPSVISESASGETRTGVSLSGSVNPENGFTFYQIEYGTTSSYGSHTYETQVGTEPGDVAVAVGPSTVSELEPGRTYHYRLVAFNGSGTGVGEDETFTTLRPTPPIVSTAGASNITHESATISATIDPQGLPSTYEFQLGPTTGYGTGVYGNVKEGAGAETITVDVQFLAPGVTYHYRIQASNVDGNSYGSDQTFTTPAYSLLTPAPVAATPPKKSLAKALTRAQKLVKALRSCRRKPSGHKRTVCVRQARKRYGPTKTKQPALRRHR
ncbi:MAG TPA: hypothetical protein VID48_09195 [Solirubrobacteraceae bacterium]|jgi:hypothetical protein